MKSIVSVKVHDTFCSAIFFQFQYRIYRKLTWNSCYLFGSVCLFGIVYLNIFILFSQPVVIYHVLSGLRATSTNGQPAACPVKVADSCMQGRSQDGAVSGKGGVGL